MPDSQPAENPRPLRSLLRKDPRRLALDVAQLFLLEACNAVPLPQEPYDIRGVTRENARSWMWQGVPPEQRDLYASWLAYQALKSTAMVENVNRLRGALWCWAELYRAVQADASDSEAAEACELMRDFLGQVWRVPSPPLDRCERDHLARKVVEGFR